jgi:hypothetical protein
LIDTFANGFDPSLMMGEGVDFAGADGTKKMCWSLFGIVARPDLAPLAGLGVPPCSGA